MKKVREILNLMNIQSVSSLIFDWFLVFYATFSNISAISWQPVLVMKESREPPILGKQLVKFITWGGESSAPFL
jgi:hypothetical protein